ncbi:hypothetical protein NFI96_007855 [Prochilodus magdalenae]|nr:hypothetical protein NFI96_007855 [Prochilodus magdalenae]
MVLHFERCPCLCGSSGFVRCQRASGLRHPGQPITARGARRTDLISIKVSVMKPNPHTSSTVQPDALPSCSVSLAMLYTSDGSYEAVKDRERQTERGRRREADGDRRREANGAWQTERQADGETGRRRDRQTGRQADRERGRRRDRQTGRQADRERGRRRQADRETGRQREADGDRQREADGDRQTETGRRRQADRDRQTETDRERQTETDRERQTETGRQREADGDRQTERGRRRQAERGRQTERGGRRQALLTLHSKMLDLLCQLVSGNCVKTLEPSFLVHVVLDSCAFTWFERISIMVILLNCVTLGMYQPCENIDCTSDRCQILQGGSNFRLVQMALHEDDWIPVPGKASTKSGPSDPFFDAFDAFIYIFFALEMVVKMVALGIFGRRCYLGDTWNRLDFFIVMAGFPPVLEQGLALQEQMVPLQIVQSGRFCKERD